MYMCNVLDPMAQKIPMQDESLPQTNPEPEMGAAAAEAAKYDTSPSLLRNPPPIPAETAHPRAPGVAQLFAMLAEMSNKMDTNARKLMDKMDGNTKKMESMNEKMDGNTDKMGKMRGEMQKMGHGLQAGIMAFASEVRTTADKMAPPRVATNELRGSASAGEDRVSRETCRVTEKVTETVTQEKLNGGDGDVHKGGNECGDGNKMYGRTRGDKHAHHHPHDGWWQNYHHCWIGNISFEEARSFHIRYMCTA